MISPGLSVEEVRCHINRAKWPAEVHKVAKSARRRPGDTGRGVRSPHPRGTRFQCAVHLTIALGYIATQKGYKTRLFSAADLVLMLEAGS